ncbi:MAG: macro domain-containing protein [Phototrophicaceae bacterium]|jgi:O-acetyl-ADP-ribose deacetylase (regulator of RNase III)
MQRAFNVAGAQIELAVGNIVKQNDMDAIVNAANSTLLGGSGVDGAIHAAAGPDLLKETRKLKGCDVGDAKITKAYKLPMKHIIHAVGPIYRGDDPNVPRLLFGAYQRSLELARDNNLKRIAFPSISTGAYMYPLSEAAPLALETAYNFLANEEKRGSLNFVRFVLFNDRIFNAYDTALSDLIGRKMPHDE